MDHGSSCLPPVFLLEDAGSIFHTDLLLGSVFLATTVMYFFMQKMKRIKSTDAWMAFALAVVLMGLYLFDFTLPSKGGREIPTMLIGAFSLVLFEFSLVVLLVNWMGSDGRVKGRA